MKEKLFKDFDSVSAKAWKQKIQVDLKGADYNEKLVTKTPHGIDIKPFYHPEEVEHQYATAPKNTWKIAEQVKFDQGIDEAILFTKDVARRGAELIWVLIQDNQLDYALYFNALKDLDLPFFVEYKSPSEKLTHLLLDFASSYNSTFQIGIDPLHHFASTGNWWKNQEEDLHLWQSLISNSNVVFYVDARLFQQAGATIPQQLAYTLSQLNEYFNWANNASVKNLNFKIINAVGANYFFEIAKLKTLPMLIDSLLDAYSFDTNFEIYSVPSLRNKTLYDYNVNMLRTTTECMAAVLGGSDVVNNLAYDEFYHKSNDFGERISRNQLLMLKEESYFDKVDNPTDGAYYIDALVHQLSENAWHVWKQIEQGGGWIQQLFEGKIQQKIKESSKNEIDAVEKGDSILVGTNKYENPEDRMKNELEISPFMSTEPRKTLIEPIIERRISEAIEKKRMANE
ncbi:MAG: methylmalonyl-CoA mutase subunit beta [Flavobacteriaceae bacterium]|nr:methylmalonyl-CoA mutase subunit beta [Flavobacteriaceae bacterium]